MLLLCKVSRARSAPSPLESYRRVNVINSREVRDLSVRQVTELMCEVMKEFLHLLQYNRVKTI